VRARVAVLGLLAAGGALALFGCTQLQGRTPPSPIIQSGSPEDTTSQADDGQLAVQESVFEVTYRLDGVISKSTSVGIDIPSGTSFAPSGASGSEVKKGQSLGALVAERSHADGTQEGTVARSQRALVATRLRSVPAPLSGRAMLSTASARVEQDGLDVVVPLKPLQELRYRGMNFSGQATVETVLGQRTSPCVAVWIDTAVTGPEPAEGGAAASASVHCRLAADIETAAGLPAVLTLTSQRLDDVLAIPLIYIGLDQTGENYVVRAREGTAWVERRVVVGATDGVRRVVTSGLRPGDVVSAVAPP
jgi:hypothetical protein